MSRWPNNDLAQNNDPHVIAWMNKYLKHGDIFYDLGANRGDMSIYANHLGARAVAIEPLPSIFVELGNRIGHDNNNILINAAVWDKYEPLLLSLSDGAPQVEVGNSIHDDIDVTCHSAKIYVIGLPLDELVKQYGIPLPDMVKCDTQGSEVRFLLGAKRTLENCKYLILEKAGSLLERNGNTIEEMYSICRNYGYKIIDSTPMDVLMERK